MTYSLVLSACVQATENKDLDPMWIRDPEQIQDPQKVTHLMKAFLKINLVNTDQKKTLASKCFCLVLTLVYRKKVPLRMHSYKPRIHLYL